MGWAADMSRLIHLRQLPEIKQLEDARQLLAVSQDLDLMLETFEPKYVLIAYYMQTRRVLHVAQDTGYAEATVRGHLIRAPFKEYLELLGYERKLGRPKADTCAKGHDMDKHRRVNAQGTYYCGECKRISNHAYYLRNREAVIERTTKSTAERRRKLAQQKENTNA